MADRIQLRRDTSANWTSANPTLAQGEVGVETNTSKLKVGDGSTAWASLAYLPSGSVTSVAMTVPSFLSVSGSPITTSGTLAVTLSGTALPVANGGTGVTSLANFTAAGTDGIAVTGGTGAVIAATSIAQHVADASHNGYLSSTDWTTFNNKASTYTVSAKSSNFTAAGYFIYLVDVSGGAINVQLPSPSSGTTIIVKDSTGNAATNNITLLRAASEQIEGISASKTLQTAWGSWTIVSDGTNWFLI